MSNHLTQHAQHVVINMIFLHYYFEISIFCINFAPEHQNL